MAASTASNLLPCLFLIITHKGNRFQVVSGQKVIIPRAHLLTTCKRAEVLPDGSRALQCFMVAKRGLSPSLSKCVLFRGKTLDKSLIAFFA